MTRKLVVNSKSMWFSVRLITPDTISQPIANVPYLLYVKDKVEVIDGSSDADGLIQCKIPFDTEFCELIIWPYGKQHIQSLHYSIIMGSTDPKDSAIGKRKRVYTTGVSTLDYQKDKELSETTKNNEENPELIIPIENLHYDVKNVVDLGILRSEKISELKELDEIIIEKEKNKEPAFEFYREQMKRSAQLHEIDKQLKIYNENVLYLKEDFKDSSDQKLYRNFERDLKINETICKQISTAKERKEPVDICENLEKMIPLEKQYVDLLGGIEIFEDELKKSEKNFEESEKKYEESKDKSPHLEKHVGKLKRRVFLLQLQIDIYEKFNSEANDSDESESKPFLQLQNTTIKYKNNPYLTTPSLLFKTDRSSYPVVQRPALVHRFHKSKDSSKWSMFGGDDETTKLTVPKPPFKLSFEYADKVGGAVRNSTIIYWVYDDKDPKKLTGSIKNFPLMYPVGLGITDGSGALKKIYDLSELNKLNETVYDVDRNEIRGRTQFFDVSEENQFQLMVGMLSEKKEISVMNCHHDNNYILYSEKPKEYEKRPDIPEKYKKMSITHFSPNMKYGFFVYPAYKNSFLTKSLLDLTEMKGSYDFPVAVKGKIEELSSKITNNQSTIKVFCPLPEWDKRLLERVIWLETLLTELKFAREPHMLKIAQLNMMQDFVENNIKYPYYKQSSGNIEMKQKFKSELEALEAGILEKITNPKDNADGHNPIFDILKEVDNAADSVMEILESEDFLDEVRNYFKHIKAMPAEELESWYKQPDAQLMPPGPYMEDEHDWGTIFITFSRAYTALNETKKSEYVGKSVKKDFEDASIDTTLLDHIEISDEDLVNFKDFVDFEPDIINKKEDPCFQDVKACTKHLGKNSKEVTIDNADSLLSIMMTGYLDQVESVAENTKQIKSMLGLMMTCPGPPSALQTIVAVYHKFLFSSISKSSSKGSFPIALPMFVQMCRILGFMSSKKNKSYAECKSIIYGNLFNRNKSNPGKTYRGLFMTDGKDIDTLSDELTSKNHPAYGSKIFRTFFTLLNICSVVTDLRHHEEKSKNEDDIMVRMLKTLELTGSVVYTGHTIYLLKHMWKPGSIAGAKVASDRAAKIANGMNGIFAVVSLYQASKIYKEEGLNSRFVRHSVTFVAASGIAIGQLAESKALKHAGRLIVKMAAKFAIREASLQTLNIIPGIGQAAMAIGTVLNIALFAYDMLGIVYSLAKDPVNKALFGPMGVQIIAMWEKFEEVDKFNTEAIENKALENHLKINTFKQYNSKYWGFKESIQAIESIKNTVEKNYNRESTDFKIDPGVMWSYFTWHAVIPLYLSHINEDFIEEAVAISIPTKIEDNAGEKTIMYFDRSVMDSTKKIIEYYETCKNPDVTQKSFMDIEEQKYKNKYIKSEKIAELLEAGSFIPYGLIQQGFRFFQWEKWNFEHYGIAPKEEGFFDIRKRIDLIKKLKVADLAHKYKETPWALKPLSMALYHIQNMLLIDFNYAFFYVEGKDFISDEDLAKLFEQAGINPKQFIPHIEPVKYAVPPLQK